MSFESDMNAFTAKVEKRHREIFLGSVLEVERSVKEGSEITGAPGQPVDTGFLKGSWIPEFISRWLWSTSTNAEYGPHVEENVRGVTFRVGGPHSVKLTISGWPRIVDAVRARVVG